MVRAETTLEAIRREARARGLRWADVADVYRELKELERAKRERANEVRRAAWEMATASTPASWPFWRHGFLARWGQRIARGSDYTCIPAYDEIGQEIASLFPEYDTDDGTERLFAFLLSPYDRLPATEQLYRRAMDRVESGGHYARNETSETVPF